MSSDFRMSCAVIVLFRVPSYTLLHALFWRWEYVTRSNADKNPYCLMTESTISFV